MQVDKEGKPAKARKRAYDKRTGRQVQISLEMYVKMFPTPTVSGNYNKKGASPNSGDGLATVIRDGGAEGVLNPDWVEWLMGWPIGWTHQEPLKDMKWPRQDWWEHEPCERTTQHRVKSSGKRKKVLGNGQVPQSFVLALFLLSEDNNL